jgi:GNAT superfamily N-acetyltransferase
MARLRERFVRAAVLSIPLHRERVPVQLWPMGGTITIRKARPGDAEAVARIYVESWRDTYPGILPPRLLLSMTVEGQTARWRNAISIAARESVLVAEDARGNVLGMTSHGRSRDAGLGFDAEIYTLYVHPLVTGRGVGRALLAGAFMALAHRGHSNCMIWAHAKNPARYFYEAMGGKLVAERTTAMMGSPVEEAGYGWDVLVLNRASRTRARTISPD